MNRNFKFPPAPPESQVKAGPRPGSGSSEEGATAGTSRSATSYGGDAEDVRGGSVTPQPKVQPPTVEIPPPSPVQKEKSRNSRSLDTDSTEDVGEIVEVDLT